MTYKGQTLAVESLERELALRICNDVIAYPECEIMISGIKTSYLMKGNPEYIDFIRNDIGNQVDMIDHPEQIQEQIIKVAVFMSEKHMSGAEVYFREQYQDCCQVITSGNCWLDIMPKEASKGNALQKLGEKLGITHGEMAAFGDNDNDRFMLEMVGHPYLMENCSMSMLDLASRAIRCSRVETELKNLIT